MILPFTAQSRGLPGSRDEMFQTRVFFSNEQPVNGIATEYKELFISDNGSYAYLVIDNYPTNFPYSQVKLKVYKKIDGVDKSYDNKTYNIPTDHYFTYIKYDFYTEGNYIFDVFTGNDAFVGTAYLNIRKKTASSSSAASSQAGGTSCITGMREYSNPDYGFSMCIPQESWITKKSSDSHALTINGFYDKKLEITFDYNHAEGIDQFDQSVANEVRKIVANQYQDFYRKEFKLISEKSDRIVYRSVIVGVKNDGSKVESSVYYIRMIGKKVKGYDYMVFNGPFCSPDDDASYQIIIELSMIGNMRFF
jgi:hypothetical protein